MDQFIDKKSESEPIIIPTIENMNNIKKSRNLRLCWQ